MQETTFSIRTYLRWKITNGTQLITINGTQVSVKFDDLEPLGSEIRSFSLRVALSRLPARLALHQYHRFDDLEIEPLCRFID